MCACVSPSIAGSWSSADVYPRLAGYELSDEQAKRGRAAWTFGSKERKEFAAFYAAEASAAASAAKQSGSSSATLYGLTCTSPVKYIGHAAIKRDIDNMAAATRTTRAERQTNPNLFATRSGTRQHQVGDVRACDQQYKTDNRHRDRCVGSGQKPWAIQELASDEGRARYSEVEGGDVETGGEALAGAVGFLGYDVARYFEKALPPPPEDESSLPQAERLSAAY